METEIRVMRHRHEETETADIRDTRGIRRQTSIETDPEK